MSVRVILNSVNGQLIVTDNFFSWAEKNNEIARSETYTGVIMVTALEMQFGGDAFTYIKNLNDEFDIAAECTAIIQNYDDLNGWVEDFNGYLDFKTLPFANSDGNNTVIISAYSSTIADKLIERESIEIPYDRLETLDEETITPFANEYIEVDVLGMEVISNNELTILENTSMSQNVAFSSILNSSIVDTWISTTLRDGTGIGTGFVANNDQTVEERIFFKGEKYSGNIRGTINISYDTGSQSSVSFRLLDYKTLTPIEVAGSSGITTPIDGVGNYDLVFDYDFDTNSRLSLYCGTSKSFVGLFSTVNDIELLSVFNTTPCKFVPPIQAFNRVANAICNEADLVDSDYLDLVNENVGGLSFLTNGSLMRQFPIGYIQTDENKVAQLSFSFKNLFDNLDKAFNLGVEVYYNTDESRYKIRVEEKDYFYKDTIILEIPKELIEEKSYKRDRELNFYYNEITCGYEYENPEEASGLEEYNSKLSFSTPAPNDNDLDLVLNYIGSGYPMEFARRIPFDGNKTTDYKYDRDNMLFNVYPDGLGGYIQRTTQNFDSITGIDARIITPINLELTGKRSFFRWDWLFNTGLRGYTTKNIKYNTSEITTNLSTSLTGSGVTVKENEENTPIVNLTQPKFSGFINSFNAPLGSSTFKLLTDNPYSIIKHWDFFNNDWAFSWIRRVSNQPSDKSTNFELIEAFNITDGDGFRILEDGGFRLLEDGGFRTIV